MKTMIIFAIATLSLHLMAAKSYQVTGPVVDVTETTITIDKKGEKFEIEKSAMTKTAGEIKKGDKATVYYSMTATEVEAKGGATMKDKKK